jgi:hypothetical protein
MDDASLKEEWLGKASIADMAGHAHSNSVVSSRVGAERPSGS